MSKKGLALAFLSLGLTPQRLKIALLVLSLCLVGYLSPLLSWRKLDVEPVKTQESRSQPATAVKGADVPRAAGVAPPPARTFPPATVPPGPPPGSARADFPKQVHLPAAAAVAPPVEEPARPPIWLFCAAQWQECKCEGTVRWGNKDKWQEFKPKDGEKTVSVKCSIQALPDILPGDDGKHCECQATPGTPFFNSINPAFLPEEELTKSKQYQVASCEIFEQGRNNGESGRIQWEAVEAFCSPSWQPEEGSEPGPRALEPEVLRRLMRAWVEPQYWGNYKKFFDGSGWTKRAFVNYYAGAPGGVHAGMTEELIKSVHLFSAEPIIVVHYGFYTPSHWTAEMFPRLILLNAPTQPSNAGRSFHFNKLRAFLLARALTGVELDSDQFVAPGVDNMFRLTEREVTKDYPLPILPAHFFPFSAKDGNLGGPTLWKRYCPTGIPCTYQTARWGHAHPTWTFWALPFYGRWLRRQLRDETLLPRKEGKMPALRVVDVKEDEDLLNVATWEEGGTKQWCKMDMPDPVEFDTLLNSHAGQESCSQGMCDNVVPDNDYNPMGVAKVFYTGHHAVNPPVTRRYVENLQKKLDNKDLNFPVLFNRKFYPDGVALKRAFPNINCII